MAITATWPSALKEFAASAKLLATDLNTYVSNALSYLYAKSGQQGTAFPSSPATNDVCLRTDFRARFQYDGSAWQQISVGSFSGGNPSSPVTNLRIYRTDLAQALYYNGSGWIVIGGTLASLAPMTSRGDLITRDASVPVRLAVGGSGTVLRSNGTDPAWTALAAADLPVATAGVRGAVIVGNDLSLASGTININKGTSFPGSPASGDLFWRTDFTPYRLYYYTGSAWSLLVGNVGCRAYSNSNVSIPNAVTTAVALNSERYDTDAVHSTSSNTSRLVAPIAGTYLISGIVSFAANATGQRAVQLWVNGGAPVVATTFVNAVGGSLTTDIAVSTIYRLAANDYVEMACYQNSGGALNVTASGNYSPELALQWQGS